MGMIASIGYMVCALAYLALAIILRSSWKGNIQGAIAILTAIACFIWAVLSAYSAYFDTHDLGFYVVELLRVSFWIAFLLVLVWARANSQAGATKLLWAISVGVSCIAAFVVALLFYYSVFGANVYYDSFVNLYVICFVLLSLVGLILIEQLFRNTSLDQRWSIKFFCVGVGGLFAYDFYLYSDALLFKKIDEHIWGARGYINTVIVPLIIISAARNPEWTLPVHVSRKFIFHSVALIGSGFYLVAIAVGGYYLKLFGGSWGSIAQVIFLFGAIVLLGLLMFSGNARAKLKIFLAKNFFNYKYDYREEWLQLIGTMSEELSSQQMRDNAIKAISNIVESSAGVMWFKDANGDFRVSANWNMEPPVDCEPNNSNLVQFLRSREWVIDIHEYHRIPELYDNLALPDWLYKLSNAWLVLPLMHQTELWGFAILAYPRVKQRINWEDRELLLTVGRQISSYMVLLQVNEALFEGRQFEAFNRLSAYVVHDLKNITAQLSLVVANAIKHRDNPAFMEDAIDTVKNATEKMSRLLEQLRKDRGGLVGDPEQINLVDLLQVVVSHKNIAIPVPQLECGESDINVLADKDRLASVLEHMIQNAQEATNSNGYVKVKCGLSENLAIIDIEDNGCGMSAEFIKQRLFKPFQTTKGNAGMGIGVYESREYVTLMGGTLGVASELNNGTTFTIRLPLANSKKAEHPIH